MSVILSIDTALQSCSIGVMRDHEIIFKKIEKMSRGQDQALPLLVQSALAEIGDEPLSAITVTLGPGSFTGIRVGMAFAKGMASVLKIPLIGLTTTQVLAHDFDAPVLAVIEIKKDTFVAQLFDHDNVVSDFMALNGVELQDFISENNIEHVVTPHDTVDDLVGKPAILTSPDPEAMLRLAYAQFQAPETLTDVVRPVYVRDADVTVKN